MAISFLNALSSVLKPNPEQAAIDHIVSIGGDVSFVRRGLFRTRRVHHVQAHREDIVDADLKCLKEFRYLTGLSLRDSGVTGEFLNDLSPSLLLDFLDLSETQFLGHHALALTRFPTLIWLFCSDTKVSEELVDVVMQLPRLDHVAFGGRLSDSSLRTLATHRELRAIYVGPISLEERKHIEQVCGGRLKILDP